MEVKTTSVLAAGLTAALLLTAVSAAYRRATEPEVPAAFSDPLHNPLTDEPRSPRWRSVRRAYLKSHPVCAACGSADDLEIHHVISFAERPDLELSPDNLLSLCRRDHFEIGHDPDGTSGPRRPDWRFSNPHVRRDAARKRKAFP